MADNAPGARVDWSPPPRQAAQVTVFKITRQPWARDAADWKVRLQGQVDGLRNPPRPFRKPTVMDAGPDAVLLGIGNLHFSDAEAVENSARWARQIAAQALLAEHDYDVAVITTRRLSA
jgi:hypothetical protein